MTSRPSPTHDSATKVIGPIVFPFLGSEIGGSHVATFILGKALMEDFGVRCIVMAAAGSLIAREAERLGFEVAPTGERTAMRHNPIYDVFMFASRVRKLAKYGRNAIVHCNDIGAFQSWLLPAKALRLRIAYHHHALNRMILPNRLIVARADAVICVSRDCRRSVAFLPDGIATTILNPFDVRVPTDIAKLRRGLAAEANAGEAAKLIGFIGNFWHRKRPFLFLDICGHIAVRSPEARFFIFGRDGEISRGELEAHAAKVGILDRTVFAGFRLPAEDNVAALDVLLMPAVREPFGRSLVEAILLGTPYVASADAGHLEIWERWRGGRLVPPEASAEAYAAEVLSVLDSPASTTLDDARKHEIAEELSATSHARQVMDVYRRLGGKRL